jgi:hypothetical protein
MRYSIGDIVYRNDKSTKLGRVTKVNKYDTCCGNPTISIVHGEYNDYGCTTSFKPIVKKINKGLTIWIIRGNVNEI